MSYLLQALSTLVQFVFGAYLILVILRFLLQLVRADFYNPISQAIVKITNPPLRPLRRIIPGYGGIDWPCVLLVFLVQALEFLLLALFSGRIPTLPALFVLSITQVLLLTSYIYLFFIFLGVIISWINPGAYTPITILIHQLTEPLLRPVRRRIPPSAGIDWSPMIVILVIFLFMSLVIAPLTDLGQALNIQR